MMEIARGRVFVTSATFILVIGGGALEVALWGLLKWVALRTVMAVEGITWIVTGVLLVVYVMARHAGAPVGLLGGNAGSASRQQQGR